MRPAPRLRSAKILFAGFVIVSLLAEAVAAAGVAVVIQKGRAFSVGALQVAPGDVVRFTNDDKFLHQIFVDTPSFSYESDEQEPGTSVEIHFSKPGRFEVRCHIHPKMLLTVDAR